MQADFAFEVSIRGTGSAQADRVAPPSTSQTTHPSSASAIVTHAGREACELVFDPCGAEPSTDIENELGSFCARGALRLIRPIDQDPNPYEAPDLRKLTGWRRRRHRRQLKRDLSGLSDSQSGRSRMQADFAFEVP
jgi:hypothetical protein